MSKLTFIQSKLKAPKNQFNKFGGYAYRSCEDILEALKPLLAEYGCHLILKDEVVLIGTRYYVRAEAYLFDGEKLIGSSTAYAREEEERKGMSGGQCTAASSSFARKYCLCGMFLCDDTKDPDYYPPPGHPEPSRPSKLANPPPPPPMTDELKQKINTLFCANLNNAEKVTDPELQKKMVEAIKDPKNFSLEMQQKMAQRIASLEKEKFWSEAREMGTKVKENRDKILGNK